MRDFELQRNDATSLVSFLACRSAIFDGESLDPEPIAEGQIYIDSYMLPTKPVLDFAADEEAARAMGLDFDLKSLEDVDVDVNVPDVEDLRMREGIN